MLTITPNPTNLTHTDTGRRKFLKQSLAGGVGSAILSHQEIAIARNSSEHQSITSSSLPHCKPSVADSVLVYFELLRQIESAEMRRLGNELAEAQRQFSQTFSEVDVLVLELELQICSSQGNQQRIKQLRELIEATRNSINNPAGGVNRAQLNLISAMCEQISKTTQCLLTENKISSDASEIINKIIAKIECVREHQVKADTARSNWRVESIKLSERLDEIRQSVGKAVRAILEYENTNQSDAAGVKAKAKAIKALDVPINQLICSPEYKEKVPDSAQICSLEYEKRKELFVKGIPKTVFGKNTPKTYRQSPVEIIVLLLQGTQMWIDNPVPLDEMPNEEGKTGNETKIILTAYGSATARPGSREERIESLLKDNCKESTRRKIDICTDTCVGVWGWRRLIPEFIRVGAIEYALSQGWYGRLPCIEPPRANITRLAVGLAKLA